MEARTRAGPEPAVATSAAHPGAVRAPERRGRFVEHGVFGMALFVFTEVMLFAGLVSAYTIARATALPGMWPPANQPRLPAGTTLFNSVVLLASGVALVLAQRAFKRGAAAAAGPMAVAMGLGAFFVVFQGVEWSRLLAQGLTLTSSLHGAFFYTIVGAHALHAVGALAGLAWAWNLLRRDRLNASAFGAVQLFWYFVVLMWPVIWLRVYR
jgi:cytochrome c oxidase subunit 3